MVGWREGDSYGGREQQRNPVPAMHLSIFACDTSRLPALPWLPGSANRIAKKPHTPHRESPRRPPRPPPRGAAGGVRRSGRVSSSSPGAAASASRWGIMGWGWGWRGGVGKRTGENALGRFSPPERAETRGGVDNRGEKGHRRRFQKAISQGRPNLHSSRKQLRRRRNGRRTGCLATI